MEKNKHHFLLKLWQIASLSLPSLCAIALTEIVSIEMHLKGLLANGSTLFIVWNVLQLIPSFAFAYLSDKTKRKNILVFSQLMGAIGCGVLYFFGMQPWVLILIAIIFNPTPVARAALLDAFPNYSTLKIVATTFFVIYFPWMFFNELSTIDFNFLVLLTMILLAGNTLLTLLIFPKHIATAHSYEPILIKSAST